MCVNMAMIRKAKQVPRQKIPNRSVLCIVSSYIAGEGKGSDEGKREDAAEGTYHCSWARGASPFCDAKTRLAEARPRRPRC